MNHDKDKKATDDKDKTDDTKTDDKATDKQPDLTQQLMAILGGDKQKAPTAKDEIAEMRMELAAMKAEKVLAAQFPNAPAETVMRLAQTAASLDGVAVETFAADLKKLVEVNTEKETNKDLEFDAAGSTSKKGDASGNRTQGMGPSNWGTSIDLAFV